MKRRRLRIDPDTWVILKQIGIGILVLGLVGLILVGIWHGTRIDRLTINEVLVSGGETINHKQVQELAERSLEGNYLGLVPRRFAWFYPEQEIFDVVSSVDRIYNVSIERKGGRTLNITFDEYIPNSLWCDEVDNNECLFLNETGYAFAAAPRLSGGTFLRFIKNGEFPKLGDLIVDAEAFQNLLLTTELLAAQNWFVSLIEIDQVGDVFFQLTAGGELKTSINLSPQEIIDNLNAILSAEEFSHLKPGYFNYLDLRFGNRVFVNEKTATSSDEEGGG